MSTKIDPRKVIGLQRDAMGIGSPCETCIHGVLIGTWAPRYFCSFWTKKKIDYDGTNGCRKNNFQHWEANDEPR